MRTYTSQPDQTTSAPVHTLDVSLLEPSRRKEPSSRKEPSGQIPRGSRIASTSTAVEALELELGVELHPLAHPLGDRGVPNNGGLQNRIRSIRRELSHQLGFTIPPVQIQRTLGLPVDAFRINVHGESLVTRKTHGEDIEPASKRVCRLIREQFTAHSQTTDHTGQVAALITRSDLQSKMQDIITLMDRSLKVITWQDVPLHRHVCVLGTIDASSP